MKRSKTYTPELREDAVKLVLAQSLTLDEAAQRLSIPKGTLGNWVVETVRWIGKLFRYPLVSKNLHRVTFR